MAQQPFRDLPLELWHQVFTLCSPNDVTLVCRSWTTLAHSIPDLWTRIHLGPPQFTDEGYYFHKARLDRAGVRPLHLSIRATAPEIETINNSVPWTRLFIYYTIRTLHISTVSPLDAAYLIRIALASSATRNALHHLAWSVDNSYVHQVGLARTEFLALGLSALPVLRSLSIPAFTPFIQLTEHINFEHLTTLVITKTTGPALAGLYYTCSLLQHTPQLETLWYKTADIDYREHVPSQSHLTSFSNFQAPIPIPILLSRLTTVCVAVPGKGAAVLACINAPSLKDLHLDGSHISRTFAGSFLDPLHRYIIRILLRLAIHSSQLRKLAITQVVISKQTWLWILCGARLSKHEASGDHNIDIQIPFPNLDTLAVHDSVLRCCGLDDAILTSYAARANLILLKRLVLRRCRNTSGDVLVSLFQSVRGKAQETDATLDFELEAEGCPGVEERHIHAMRALGMETRWDRRRDVVICSWNKALERIYVPDEKPWWTIDSQEVDPLDSGVF